MGMHACCRFQDDHHRRSVLRRFFEEGIYSNQRIAYFGRHSPDLRVADYVGSVEIMHELLESGQLLLGSSEEAYPQGDAFDGIRIVAEFEGQIQRALDDGYAGMRVYADNGWLPEKLATPGHWVRYELLVTQMIDRYPLFGLCGFSVDDPDALSAEAIDALHDSTYPSGQRAPVRVGVADEHALAVAGSLTSSSTEVLDEIFEAATIDWHEADVTGLRPGDVPVLSERLRGFALSIRGT